ncbi:condensation domain-containing protein [Amycolatopsis cihanbeyliensis]|uniref:Condensation domain-containing protein n=1 Tax=Amycolatopsis cihanbeyliensis TaxID=1128664 RepID=A0A542DG90_AMYCI|nr:condensation domain-containing protein [Amycolatopsis cihanbeyliensis]TQJ02103.1 condensation domain-containing protein [Amycolatopsis cihanbeyliensis]
MRFTEISDYQVRPGRLTEWRPRAEEAAWVDDPRPPSYVQEAHLRNARAQRDSGRGTPTWLATAFELPGRLDPEALESALLAWTDRHETLRSSLRCVPSPRGGTDLRRRTLAGGAVSIERRLIGEVARADEVGKHVEELFDHATSPLDWPPYVFVTVERPDSSTIYLGLDHTNVDGYSILLIAHEIRELYAAAVAGDRAELAETGSYLEFSRLERDEASVIGGEHETIAAWREFVRTEGGELPAFPLAVGGRQEVPVPQSSTCTWLLDPDQADSFEAACRKGGEGFFAGVLACLGIAGHEVSGRPSFRALAPFHTRSEARWAASLGWYIGLIPLHIRVAGEGNFHNLTRSAAAAARDRRPMAKVPFARVCEVLDLPLEPRFVVSYMDMRRTPGAREWREWNTCAFHSRMTGSDEVYVWIHRNHEGVYVTCRYPDTEAGNRNVLRYIGHLRRVIDEIAARGSYAIAGLPAIPPADIAIHW